MTPHHFTVSVSGRVADAAREVLAEAGRLGLGTTAAAAFESIVRRLADDPQGVGEAREILPAMGVRVRVVVEPPLVVWYGVHEEQRIVWVQRVLLRPPGRR